MGMRNGDWGLRIATLFLFNGDQTSFTAITKQKKGTEEYNRFFELINSQYKNMNCLII